MHINTPVVIKVSATQLQVTRDEQSSRITNLELAAVELV